METNNPYAPPGANVFDGSGGAPLQDASALRYAGFWQRFFAFIVDFLVLLPLTGLVIWLGEKSRLFMLYWFVPGIVIGLLFHVYLVKRYGGTPGKLVLKTRIAMVDGSAVTMKAAMLRYAGLLILTSLSSLALLQATLGMSDETYLSLDYITRSTKMVELAPGWYGAVSILLQVWIWSEFITMLFNKRRRALHDFIAGTVVLRKD